MPSKPKDLTGIKYGRLTGVENTFTKNKGGNFIWKFVCDCGNEIATPSGNVVFGHTQSCGCYAKESAKNRVNSHGMQFSKEYKSWCKAKERCFNPDCKTFKDYGARGITMSDEFSDSFVAFVKYIGLMPVDGKRYTLDRIENSKGYQRGNIRWATNHQQARNKKFQKNNSSGETGVTWDVKPWDRGEKLYAKAYWNSLEGKQQAKRFSVDTYGLLPAFKMAVEYRRNMIQELNTQGAQYSEHHGK